jgi:hypothetical protein
MFHDSMRGKPYQKNTAIAVPRHFLQTLESRLSLFSENVKTSQGLVFW